MKDSIKKTAERLLILVIVFVSTAVLCMSLWNDDDLTAETALAAVLAAVLIMMIKAMIINLRKYAASGEFFGTTYGLAGLGVIAYISSRLCWGYIMIYFIFISYLSGSDDMTVGDIIFAIALVVGFLTIIMGAIFFSLRASGKGKDEQLFRGKSENEVLKLYGLGEEEYTIIPADRFIGTDELSRRVAAIVSNDDADYAALADVSPFVAAIEDGYLITMPGIMPRDFGALVRQSEQTFLKSLNRLFGFLSYDIWVSEEQWRAELKRSADTCLINRLRDKIGVDYFMLNCAEHLLRERGFALVQFTFEQGGSYCAVIRSIMLDDLRRLIDET